MNASRNDKLLDALVKVAIEESVEKEMQALPDIEELNKMYPLSTTLDKRVKEIIAAESRKHKRKQVAKTMGKMAASIAIFCTIGAALLFSVEGSRIFILNTLIDHRNDHIAVEFWSYENLQEISLDLSRGLPAGYEFMDIQLFDTMTITRYETIDGLEILMMEQFDTNLTVAVSTDFRDFSIIEIGGHDVYLFDATGSEGNMHVIMWSEGPNVVQMISAIDVNELLALVEFVMQN